MYIRLLSRRWR